MHVFGSVLLALIVFALLPVLIPLAWYFFVYVAVPGVILCVTIFLTLVITDLGSRDGVGGWVCMLIGLGLIAGYYYLINRKPKEQPHPVRLVNQRTFLVEDGEIYDQGRKEPPRLIV